LVDGAAAGEWCCVRLAARSQWIQKPNRRKKAISNENGDVEQRHYRLKREVNQSLLLRDSRDFPSLGALAAVHFREPHTGTGPAMHTSLRLKNQSSSFMPFCAGPPAGPRYL
jgi:hypothetical protein